MKLDKKTMTTNKLTFYSEVLCPKGNCTNLVYCGDPDDLTIPDIEAIICGRCNHKWLLYGAEDWTSLDEANVIIGKRKKCDAKKK